MYPRDVDFRRANRHSRTPPTGPRQNGRSQSGNASSLSGRRWQTRSLLEQTPTNSDFVDIWSAGTNPSSSGFELRAPMGARQRKHSSRIATGLGARETSARPLPPVDLAKQETPIMADAPPPQAIKTVPKPRDQHLRDMADCIRFLSMDAVQQANSGHPGAPMGMADIATVLFRDFMQFDAADPHWFDRDRFVLSNGHASMLLYSLLYLTGSRI